jgi:hypothetical protein
VKRSTDRGQSWGAITEIGRTAEGTKSGKGWSTPSPEGCSIFGQRSGSVLTIWQSNNISNATTGLRLWQAETDGPGPPGAVKRPSRFPK